MADVCDIPGVSSVCEEVAEGLVGTSGSITERIGQWIADSVADMASDAADLAASAVDSTTTVNLEAEWFRDNYALLLPIALVAIGGSFSLQLVYAAARQDGTALRRALTGTISGVLFACWAVPFTVVALTIVDALSSGLFQAANTSLAASIRRVIRVSLVSDAEVLGWATAALLAIGMTIGAWLYWGVMLFRKVAILVLVSLAPFAGAGGGWDTARRMRRGWIEVTASLVASKLLMTIIFLVGLTAIGKADADDGITALSDALAGLVVLLLVLICPFACYRFVRWAGDGAASEETHRSANVGVSATVRGAKATGTMVAQAFAGGGAPGGSAAASGTTAGGTTASSGTSSAAAGATAAEPTTTPAARTESVTAPPPTAGSGRSGGPTGGSQPASTPGPSGPSGSQSRNQSHRPSSTPPPLPPPQGRDEDSDAR